MARLSKKNQQAFVCRLDNSCLFRSLLSELFHALTLGILVVSKHPIPIIKKHVPKNRDHFQLYPKSDWNFLSYDMFWAFLLWNSLYHPQHLVQEKFPNNGICLKHAQNYTASTYIISHPRAPQRTFYPITNQKQLSPPTYCSG